ncbi:methyltransferase domain-containing protein [Simkania negevensis]|uniref:Putative methyltransferase n=1 Tax=Simkania negevensis (strain ATCC VR-1471 / DSM 27360 / Z) TaxID=331113 RepID=F8L317_SIMNZ|nr:methyltransferase domain-containing protein [Simkania negevensis]CCB87863.1 putative methyltransferase [Simkania negevensis Z]
MYEDGLHHLSMFEGGYINFGYWDHVKSDNGILTKSQRIESEKNLYRFVGKRMRLGNRDKVLELGCGLGLGTVFLYENYYIDEIIGVDFSENQIARAMELHSDLLAHSKKVVFQKGDAQSLEFEDESFSKVISIEAAQHFESFELFANESYRVLKKDGLLGIATFFGKGAEGFSEACSLIPTIENGTDKLYMVSDIEKILYNAGFKDVEIISIGKNVWDYLDRWISQGSLKDSWDRNWLLGYKKQIFDYYVLLAKKPI